MNADSTLTAFREQYGGKVNLLLIDDQPDIHTLLITGIFTSPLFNIHSALSMETARSLCAQTGRHAWILDLVLDKDTDGTDLLSRIPPYPYVIGLSGLRSMESASRAISRGVMAVFDKDPALFYCSDRFYNEVCHVAALGFILRGKHCDSLPVFRLLRSEMMTSVEQWAGRACITYRHLVRLCEQHCHLPPKQAICLYNALYFGLRGEEMPPCLEEVDSKESQRITNCRDQYLDAMSVVLKYTCSP